MWLAKCGCLALARDECRRTSDEVLPPLDWDPTSSSSSSEDDDDDDDDETSVVDCMETASEIICDTS